MPVALIGVISDNSSTVKQQREIMTHAIRQQIIEKTKHVFALATEKYGFDVDFNDIHLVFKNKGRSAGQASIKRHYRKHQYGLMFSLESAALDMDEMLNDTIPHEVAHLVNFNQPHTGKNHDMGWKSVCIGLGGHGGRTHSQELTKTKYRKQYLYVTDSGDERIVGSAKKHNNIQHRGAVYTIRATGEKYGKEQFVRVISADEHRRNHTTKVQAARTGYTNIKDEPATPPPGWTPKSEPNWKLPPKDMSPQPTAPMPTFEGPRTEPNLLKPDPVVPPLVPVTTPRKTSGKVSKKVRAQHIYTVMVTNGESRANIIKNMMTQLDMTKAGASTYYANAKKAAA